MCGGSAVVFEGHHDRVGPVGEEQVRRVLREGSASKRLPAGLFVRAVMARGVRPRVKARARAGTSMARELLGAADMTATQHAVAYESVVSSMELAESETLDPTCLAGLVEDWIEHVLPPADTHPAPLHRAMRYAVLSGGKRLRPLLLLHVASACAASGPGVELALRAACAVELVHAASLVHDDLPCFDDADERRGRPTVHVLTGEPMAVLVGDALLSLAFEVLAGAPSRMATRALKLLRVLGQATGSASGIIGGQSLEGAATREDATAGFSAEQVEHYHAMKTGALFRFAAEAGAVAAGAASSASWAEVGQLVGAWYQMADDLMDACADAEVAGKPVGRDAALGRPRAIRCDGEDRVRTRMTCLLDEIHARIAGLAIAPRPLLALVEQVHRHVLHAVGEGAA